MLYELEWSLGNFDIILQNSVFNLSMFLSKSCITIMVGTNIYYEFRVRKGPLKSRNLFTGKESCMDDVYMKVGEQLALRKKEGGKHENKF